MEGKAIFPPFEVSTGLLIGRGKKVKFRGILRDKFAEKSVDFVGISRELSGQTLPKTIGKKRLILWLFSMQISLEIDRFCGPVFLTFF